MKGWYRDNWRHSLAAKGIRTSFVANSRKGNYSRPEDFRWDPERKKFVDWRKRASALGIETGNKRKTLVGNTPDIISPINVYERKLEPFRTIPVPEIPGANIAPIPELPSPEMEISAPEMEIPPAEALPSAEEEQQAQPVEGRPSEEESVPPRVLVTSGVPQVPSPLAEEIREVRFE
jgi:hypothetical protein